MTDWPEEEIKKRIGWMINKCPSCNHKNIQYIKHCEECGFSWEIYYNQEFNK